MSKESNWVKIDPNKADEIPDQAVWVYTKDKKVVFVEQGEFIPFNFCTHYQLPIKPEPPQQ